MTPLKHYRIVSKPNAVRRVRIVGGQTMEEFASAVGISRALLSGIENGKGTSLKTAHTIARVLGKTFEDLFEVVDQLRPNG